MIGSGHLSYYLKAYGNLYHYSQQGWEALNQKIKFIFFHNTQRGGQINGKNGGDKHKYLLPIAEFLQWEVMWQTGLGEEYFLQKERKNQCLY